MNSNCENNSLDTINDKRHDTVALKERIIDSKRTIEDTLVDLGYCIEACFVRQDILEDENIDLKKHIEDEGLIRQVEQEQG